MSAAEVEGLTAGRRAFVLRVLAGPLAFAAVRAVPLAGLGPERLCSLAVSILPPPTA